MATYTVQKGDTLGKLAAAWGTTVKDIMAANPQITNADLIRIGWNLVIPGKDEPVGGGGGATTPTSDPFQASFGGQELLNVPGKPEVWKVGDEAYLVYMVPGTEKDPVYLAWEVADGDLEAFFGPDKTPVFDRTFANKDAWAKNGVLEFGSTDQIPPGERDPFASWVYDMEVQSQTQPWILEDDYQALAAKALVEGRQLTQAEIATTNWWKSHSAAERSWMILYHGDPQTAEDALASRRIAVRDQLVAAGADPGSLPDEVINFMADQFTTGKWTEAYLANQVRAVTDPFAGIVIDPALAKKNLEGVGTTQQGEDRVRSLLHTWLGPAFGEWDADEVRRIAGEIRNDPDAEQNFIESLKDQRMALFPKYTDRNQSYATISNVWKQWWLGQWGQNPDEKDPLFMQVLNNNDINESGKLLRREGLARGVGKVTDDLSSAALAMSGGSERRPITP